MKLVCMMRQIDKQIIITTHIPEISDYSKLENVNLITRDLNGFFKIIKPSNNDKVKEFVEYLGIGHVFLNNYLGYGNG